MEFHFGLWNGVSALYSDSGRQLGEENARPFVLNHHVEAETIDCKYKGSREGRPINMSALRIAMQNFDAGLAITQAVRSHHLDQLPQSHTLGIWDLYIIARASIAIIAYRQRFKHQTGVRPSVTDALTSQYQFISGVFMICRHMMENGDPAIITNRPMTADELYSYADRHGIFISFNGMACAGSAKKINEFLELCCNGDSSVAANQIELSDLVSQRDNWYQYALATIELDCFIERERAVRKTAGPTGHATHLNQSAQINENVRDYARNFMNEAPPSDHVAFQEGALLRQNCILKLLKRPSIREIPEKHFRARMG